MESIVCEVTSTASPSCRKTRMEQSSTVHCFRCLFTGASDQGRIYDPNELPDASDPEHMPDTGMKDLNTPHRTNQLVAPDKASGRRVRIAIYVLLCVAASLVPQALALLQYPSFEGDGAEVIQAIDMLRALGGLLALAVLTFPVGVVAVLLWMPMVTSGIATPFEGVGALLHVFIVLGYLQWFVWIPKLVCRRSKATH